MGYEIKSEQSFNKKVSKVEKRILQPVGDSPNMCAEERNTWNEWNNSIPKLALEFPSCLYTNGQTVKKKICLTFDDAPDVKNTPEILNVLKQYKVKASFFVVGMRIDALPQLVRRIYDEGHLVLNHTWQHYDLTTIDCETLREEIVSTEDKIYQVINRRTALVRPPYGIIDKNAVEKIKDLGYRTVVWSLNTFDWLEKTKDNIVKNVLDNARPGDIVLMHSYKSKEPTVEALPIIITELRARGYEFERLSEMLGIDAYKEEL